MTETSKKKENHSNKLIFFKDWVIFWGIKNIFLACFKNKRTRDQTCYQRERKNNSRASQDELREKRGNFSLETVVNLPKNNSLARYVPRTRATDSAPNQMKTLSYL